MAGSTKRNFKTGETLFKEGDFANCMYIIQEGTVAITKRRLEGQVEIARLHSKEVLGELSFFDRGKRSASAVAVTDVEVLEIDFDSLDKVFAGVPPYIKTIMTAVAERLRRANDLVKRLQHNEAATELAEAEPAPAPKSLSQTDAKLKNTPGLDDSPESDED